MQDGARPDTATPAGRAVADNLFKFHDFSDLVQTHFATFNARRKEGLIDGKTRRSDPDILGLVDSFHLAELVRRLRRTSADDPGTVNLLRAVLGRIKLNRPPRKDEKKKSTASRNAFAALMGEDSDDDNDDD